MQMECISWVLELLHEILKSFWIFTELDIGIGTEVDNETDDSWKQGRRIVELEKMAQDMFCDMCAAWLHLKDTVRETHYGLGSILFIKCTACGAVKRLALGKQNDDGGFDIKRKIVVGNIFACIFEW